MIAGEFDEMARLRSGVRRTEVSLGLKVKSSNAKVAIAFVNESVLTTKFYPQEAKKYEIVSLACYSNTKAPALITIKGS